MLSVTRESIGRLVETKGLDGSPAAPIDAGSTSEVILAATGTSIVSLGRGRLTGTFADGALKTFVNSCVTFCVTIAVIWAITSSGRPVAVMGWLGLATGDVWLSTVTGDVSAGGAVITRDTPRLFGALPRWGTAGRF